MPSATPKKPRKSQSSLAQARDRLRGVLREDSDDELGYEDHPWEWVYSKDPAEVGEHGRRKIMGAKMGSFDVGIGDCVLIKGEGLKSEAYVGMVVEFDDVKKEKMANVMWFSTEGEVRNKTKRRTDAIPVFTYSLWRGFGHSLIKDRMSCTSTQATTASRYRRLMDVR